MATISVVVPVYRVEPYLRRCVDSILGQTFKDFELILVDDGSPDRCGEICDEYVHRDDRVHVIHQTNGGLSVARNAGIDWAFANSQSKYIAFIDSDDWVAPNYLEMLHNGCKFCDIACVEHLSVQEGRMEEIVAESGELFKLSPYLYWKVCVFAVTAWGKLYKKALFANVRFPKDKIHEDEYIVPNIVFKCQSVAYFEASLYYYLKRDDSIMGRDFCKKRLDLLQAKHNQIKLFNDLGFLDLARNEMLSICNLYVSAITILGEKRYRKLLQRALIELHLPSMEYRRLYKVAFPVRAFFILPVLVFLDNVFRLGFVKMCIKVFHKLYAISN